MSYNEILVTRNLQSDGISRVVDGCHYVYLEYIDTYLGIPVYVSDNYLNDDPVLCGRKPTYGVIIRSSSILPHVDSEMVIVIERHVYNDPIIRDMIILHEIGHWVLGHIGSDIDIHVKEIDADIFSILFGGDPMYLIDKGVVRRPGLHIAVLKFVRDHYLGKVTYNDIPTLRGYIVRLILDIGSNVNNKFHY